MRKLRYLGLDVHAETIAVAVAEPTGEGRGVGQIPNRPEAVRRLVKKLGAPEQLRACYEAGPTGYVLYWQLTALGVACEVVAPTLVPSPIRPLDHCQGRYAPVADVSRRPSRSRWPGGFSQSSGRPGLSQLACPGYWGSWRSSASLRG